MLEAGNILLESADRPRTALFITRKRGQSGRVGHFHQPDTSLQSERQIRSRHGPQASSAVAIRISNDGAAANTKDEDKTVGP